MSPFVASILSILARKAIEYAKNLAVKSARPRGSWLGKASDASVTDEAAVQAGYKSGTPCRLIIADEKRTPSDGGTSPASNIGWGTASATGGALRHSCATR